MRIDHPVNQQKCPSERHIDQRHTNVQRRSNVKKTETGVILSLATKPLRPMYGHQKLEESRYELSLIASYKEHPPEWYITLFFSFLLCCGYLSRVVFHVLSADISMGNTCNNSPGLVYADASKSLGSNFLSKFSCKAITVISFLCLYNRFSSWWWCEVKGVGLEFLSREGSRNSLIQMYFYYPRTFIPIKLLCP